MTKVKPKLLAFYGIAIAIVTLLFKTVTAYGETRLQAPPPLGGSYRLQLRDLPDCFQKEPKILLIKQSGLYLHGLLLAESSNLSPEVLAEEKPTLSGKVRGETVNLTGTIPLVGTCDSVRLKASVKKKMLSGTLDFGGDGAIAFTAEKAESKPQSSELHH